MITSTFPHFYVNEVLILDEERALAAARRIANEEDEPVRVFIKTALHHQRKLYVVIQPQQEGAAA